MALCLAVSGNLAIPAFTSSREEDTNSCLLQVVLYPLTELINRLELRSLMSKGFLHWSQKVLVRS